MDDHKDCRTDYADEFDVIYCVDHDVWIEAFCHCETTNDCPFTGGDPTKRPSDYGLV